MTHQQVPAFGLGVIQLETDHKPLVPLLGQNLLPPRVLRFIIQFQYTIQYVPGKSLYTADTFSRAPLKESSDIAAASSTETEQFVQAIRAVLPASANCLETYAAKQANDRICSKLIHIWVAIQKSTKQRA